jgi:hypothetical protein
MLNIEKFQRIMLELFLENNWGDRMKTVQHVLIAGAILFLAAGTTQASSSSAGFIYETQIKNSEEIVALADQDLLDAYVDLLIDLEASTIFSRTAGFNQQDFFKFKKLIRYRVDLRKEILKRKLKVPGTGAIGYY